MGGCVCVCVHSSAEAEHRSHKLGLLYATVAVLACFTTSAGGSYLKQGSRLLIFMVMIDDRVPSRDSLFLVSVLFRPINENIRSASAFE